MFIAILLSALVLWAMVATVIEVRRDGYRPAPTDWARVAGYDPLPTSTAGMRAPRAAGSPALRGRARARNAR